MEVRGDGVLVGHMVPVRGEVLVVGLVRNVVLVGHILEEVELVRNMVLVGYMLEEVDLVRNEVLVQEDEELVRNVVLVGHMLEEEVELVYNEVLVLGLAHGKLELMELCTLGCKVQARVLYKMEFLQRDKYFSL